MSKKAALRRALVAGAAVVATAAVTVVAVGSSANAHLGSKRFSVTTVISGLNAPRDLLFDERGFLYVAESGLVGEGTLGINHTGAVSKYRLRPHGVARLWSTSFSSLYTLESPDQPTFALGPEGLSTLGWGCSVRHACPITMIMSYSRTGALEKSGGAIDDGELGHLYALDRRTGRATDLANVGDQHFAWTVAHPNPLGPPDANPYDVIVTRDPRSHRVRTFVVDAGANVLSEVLGDGTVRVVAEFPNDAITQSTPTCLAQGPDGALYVGTLSLVGNFVAGGGASTVWRVDPNASYPTPPQVWTTGLTTVTSCTFDRHGNFWATEMFGPSFAAPNFGDVVKVPFRHPDRIQRFGDATTLPFPGGITQGPDGAIYVSINSALPGPAGAVVRFSARWRR